MNTVQILTLLLTLSGALNIAFGAGIVARVGGLSISTSILIAGGAAATRLTAFFTAIPKKEAAYVSSLLARAGCRVPHIPANPARRSSNPPPSGTPRRSSCPPCPTWRRQIKQCS
jgi:hypothetical protein